MRGERECGKRGECVNSLGTIYIWVLDRVCLRHKRWKVGDGSKKIWKKYASLLYMMKAKDESKWRVYDRVCRGKERFRAG